MEEKSLSSSPLKIFAVYLTPKWTEIRIAKTRPRVVRAKGKLLDTEVVTVSINGGEILGAIPSISYANILLRFGYCFENTFRPNPLGRVKDITNTEVASYILDPKRTLLDLYPEQPLDKEEGKRK